MSSHRTSFAVRSGARFARTARVAVIGDLDVAAVPGFRALLDAFVREAEVVICLRECPFVDAAGIGALVGAVRRVQAAGGTARVTGASEAIRVALRAASAETILVGGLPVAV